MRLIKTFLKYQLVKGVWNAVRNRQAQNRQGEVGQDQDQDQRA